MVENLVLKFGNNTNICLLFIQKYVLETFKLVGYYKLSLKNLSGYNN